MVKDKKEKIDTMTDSMNSAEAIEDEGIPLLSKMNAVFDNLPFDSWVKDHSGRYIAVNKTYYESCGYCRDAMLGMTDHELFDSKKALDNTSRDDECISGKKQMHFEELADNGNWAEIYLSPIIDESGKVIGTAGYSRDITEKKTSEIALINSENRLKRAQKIARMGNWEIESGSSQIWASEEFFRIFGFESNETACLPLEQIRQTICKEDRLRRDVAFKLLMEKNRNYDVEYKIERPIDGLSMFIRSSAVMELDQNGKPYKAVGIIQDISDRKRKEEEIDYLNQHDLLTGVFNRSHFENELKIFDRSMSLPLSVIMVDVNGLKLTNDMFGHSEGDRLLICVSTILRDCCPPGGIVARIGGDEFCVLLPNITSEEAKRISAAIQKSCEGFKGSSCIDLIYPSVSLGQATKIHPEELMSAIMIEAESLMQKRKLLERKSLRSSVISSIKTTLFEKSHETEEHAERLVELSKMVGLEMGLADMHLNDLSLLASLHDIGKMGVDEYILCKPGELSEEEWAEIRRHPEVGYRIAKSSPELMPIADYILCHHERWDGKGYPQGLKSKNIPLLSRILAVVDAYDAMTQDRAYRKAAPKDLAIYEIIKHSGTQFDPDVAIVFIKTMQNKLS